MLSLYTEFQCPTMLGTGQKVCGGGGWWWVCKPIILLNLSYLIPIQILGDCFIPIPIPGIGISGYTGYWSNSKQHLILRQVLEISHRHQRMYSSLTFRASTKIMVLQNKNSMEQAWAEPCQAHIQIG